MKNFNSALILFLFLLGCTSCRDSGSSGFSFSDLFVDDMIMKIVEENMKEKDYDLMFKVRKNIKYLSLKNHKQYYLDLSAAMKKLYTQSKRIELRTLDQNIQIVDNKLMVNGQKFDPLFNKDMMELENRDLLKKLHIHFLLLLTGHNYNIVYAPKQGLLTKPALLLMKQFEPRKREESMAAF